MAWARLDDSFHDHPKVDGLSLSAVGLYTLCLTWAHRHRKTALLYGHITEARVQKLAGKQGTRLAAELVTANLWEIVPDPGGWVIHDFADYLPKERDPDERAEAGRKGARAKWLAHGKGNGKPDGKLPPSGLGNGMANDGSRASAPASPSRPVPSMSLVESSGDRNETLPPPPATRPRCSKHPNGNPLDTNCAGCRRVREWDDREAATARDDVERRRTAAVLAELEDAKARAVPRPVVVSSGEAS